MYMDENGARVPHEHADGELLRRLLEGLIFGKLFQFVLFLAVGAEIEGQSRMDVIDCICVHKYTALGYVAILL